MTSTDLPAPGQTGAPRRLLLTLPLIVFFALAALLLLRLGAGDPSLIPSALIGHPVPGFALEDLPGRASGVPGGLKDADLRSGHATLVNVFASWCAECHDEHGLLMEMARDPKLKGRGIALDGIVYKDKAEDARRYLGQKGDPYGRVGNDDSGRTGIDFGVYGVPETFVIKGDNTIAFKLIGPITPTNMGTLLGEIDKASR